MVERASFSFPSFLRFVDRDGSDMFDAPDLIEIVRAARFCRLTPAEAIEHGGYAADVVANIDLST